LNGIISFFCAPVPVILIAAGLFFSFSLKFFWLRHPIKLFRSLAPKRSTGISPLRALSLALSGTLGVGNIVGVAGAIAIGGFGAIFWMWMSALCAMVLKYAEIVLALEHRREREGERFGGAPYYIKDFFTSRGLPRLGFAVAAVFALLCFIEVLSTGCGIQINAAASALRDSFGIPPIAVGALAAALTVYAVSGGADRASKLTAIVIPTLSAAYIAVSIAAVFIGRGALPGVFSSIFADAFSFDSAAGGIFGFLFCRAVRIGAMRGLLSNEAGCGTAPLAHAASSGNCSVEQGVLGLFEVFFDTVILCTLTAAVIIISYDEVAHLASEPLAMAFAAYSALLGPGIEYFLSAAVAIFGLSTVICCAHYARECLFFLFGRKRGVSRICLAIYALAAALGSCLPLNFLWQLSDLSLALMTAINVTALLCLGGEVRRATKDYFENKR